MQALSYTISRRHRRLCGFALSSALLIMLGACGINAPGANPTLIVTAIPTNTLAPIVTTTERFTATPPPSETLIPTPTPSATDVVPTDTATSVPTATPTVQISGAVRVDGGIVNLRTGPGSTFKVIGNLKAGSPIQILFTSIDTKWTLVKLDDGSQGWVSSTLVTLLNPSVTVPALDTPALTQFAVQSTALSLTQAAMGPATAGGPLIDANAPTHRAKIDLTTDVLAYCDQRSDATRDKKFTQGAKITVFWSWEAKTPEQIKDQLNYAQYTVTVDDQAIGDWKRFASPVEQQSNGSYIVYWFVPLGTQASGDHKISFKVAWTQSIFDGTDHWGPGTTKTTDTGTCTFTVK